MLWRSRFGSKQQTGIALLCCNALLWYREPAALSLPLHHVMKLQGKGHCQYKDSCIPVRSVLLIFEICNVHVHTIPVYYYCSSVVRRGVMEMLLMFCRIAPCRSSGLLRQSIFRFRRIIKVKTVHFTMLAKNSKEITIGP